MIDALSFLSSQDHITHPPSSLNGQPPFCIGHVRKLNHHLTHCHYGRHDLGYRILGQSKPVPAAKWELEAFDLRRLTA